MKADTFTNAELREAARRVAGAMAGELPPEETRIEPSEEFERRMERTVKRAAARSGARRAVRGITAGAAAAIVSLSLWLTFDVDARAAFRGWVTELMPDGLAYSFTNEQARAGLPDYTLTWVPEGYKPVMRDEKMNVCIYQNGEESLYFAYSRVDTYALLSIGETSSRETVYVNGTPADYYTGTEESPDNGIVWIDEDRGVALVLIGNFSADEFVKMLESVK